jgi:hypothetical protein
MIEFFYALEFIQISETLEMKIDFYDEAGCDIK